MDGRVWYLYKGNVERVDFTERKFARVPSVIISRDSTSVGVVRAFCPRVCIHTVRAHVAWTCRIFLPFSWRHHPILFRCHGQQDTHARTYICEHRPKITRSFLCPANVSFSRDCTKVDLEWKSQANHRLGQTFVPRGGGNRLFWSEVVVSRTNGFPKGQST